MGHHYSIWDLGKPIQPLNQAVISSMSAFWRLSLITSKDGALESRWMLFFFWMLPLCPFWTGIQSMLTSVCTTGLPVFEAWLECCQNRGLCGLMLHDDNASEHTAAATMDFLAISTVTVPLVPIPLYSPASPCGWCLFPCIKKHLQGIWEFMGAIKTIDKNHAVRKKWIHWIEKYVVVQTDLV